MAQTVKASAYNAGDLVPPWVGNIPWSRKWQPIPVLLPWKSHGWRSLVSYSSWDCKEWDTTEQFHSLHNSVQLTHTVKSDSVQPHGLQHGRPPCQSPNSGVYSNSCPLTWSCHPTISSSHPFCSCLQCFPASGSFPKSKFFTSGGQRIGVSASASVLPMNIQDWSPLGWTGWISLQSKTLSRSLLQHHSLKTSILGCSPFFSVQLSHPYMTTGKTIALTRWTFFGKVMSLLFNMLSRLVKAFLSRSKRLLISWLQSPPAVIWEPKKHKFCHCFHCFPIYLSWSDGTRCHDLSFLNAEF